MQVTGTEADFKAPFLTGYFRDMKRRIDMVIVMKDTNIPALEKIKVTFLIAVIDIGLEIEVEPGRAHEGLIFIKVHAPEHILQHFGVFFDIKKIFRISHMELMKEDIEDERHMIRVIRLWYPSHGFSTYERSLIVNRVLLSMPFGIPVNYNGVNQLIKKNLVVDMYPLHDGPYHLTPGQSPMELQSRQALYYNWTGYRNLFRKNPINLIREYLGERIG